MGRLTAPPARHVVGVALTAACWALTVAALALVASAPPAADELVSWYADRRFFALHAMTAVTAGTGGGLIVVRGRHPVGPVLALVGLLYAGAVCCLGWSIAGVEPGWPGVGLTAHAFTWLAGGAAFFAVAVLPWFLRPGPMPVACQALAAVGAVGSVAITVGGALAQQPEAPTNPLALDSPIATAIKEAGPAVAIVCVLVGALAMAELVRRVWREAGGSRATYLLAGALPVLLVAISVLHLQLQDNVDDVMLLAVAAAQTLLVLAVVVLAQHSWGLAPGLLVPRVAAWVLLSFLVVALYVGVVTLAGQLLPVGDRIASAAGLAVLALLVDPLRRWLQRRVNLYVYGAAADPELLRSVLVAGMRTSDPQRALDRLVPALRRHLRAGWVSVRSCGDPAVEVTAGRWRPDEMSTTHPLSVRGRHVGELVVQARPGDVLTPQVRRTTQQLTDLVALTVDLTQAERRLRSASERLIRVRTDAHRWARRELHDGMGPVLAGVGLGLAAAQRRLQHDPEAAERLIDDLRTEIDRRTDGLRLRARALLPGELDDGDLRGALSVLAARFSGDGLRVRVDTCGLHDLDMPRLAACYHVAAEALVNVHRHAGATSVQIRVWSESEGAAVLEVVDDGCGIPAEHRQGVGLRSMRERAEELGGRLEIRAGPDGRGALIRMELP